MVTWFQPTRSAAFALSRPPATGSGVNPGTVERALKAAAPLLTKAIADAKEAGRAFAKSLPAPPDERPGDYLDRETYDRSADAYSLCKAHVTRDRYPPPEQADLVTMWRKDGRAVLSVTSQGATADYFVAPNVVAFLAKESIELLSHSTNLKG